MAGPIDRLDAYITFDGGNDSMYQLIYDGTWDVLHEGTEEECKMIFEAFMKYNGANKLVIREKE